MFKLCSNQEEAYDQECFFFHQFGEEKELDNEIHLDSPPDELNLECPYH